MIPSPRHSIRLGPAQETLLIPLYARAIESRRPRPILADSQAVAMVESIDWDFRRFDQRRRIVACVLRTAIFDHWVAAFLERHPEATVIEIGAGLNDRFERLDNGRVHWFDLDLPDTVELRRRFFADSTRRRTLTGSALDSGWIETVAASPGPYFFVAEAVFIYLPGREVKDALARIAARFARLQLAFDTASRKAVTSGNKDFVRTGMAARFDWACDDPAEIERWGIGLRRVESRTLADVPERLRARLSLPLRAALALARAFPKIARMYQLNLFTEGADE